nr:MAG TPA: hypothetical protein [Caudoviricetes sp.]
MFILLYIFYVGCDALCPMFHGGLCNFIDGKFGVSYWMRNHRITVSFA